ncbi:MULTISPECIES: aldo/keto reductase [unclassified Streptomyces]|uniref:aldo/keto reductase n=1 Tax=unclassified Streptomyces TaxID=2593676 RepID=UPI0023668F78|nr:MULTISPECIES: aldo/keto reductase [unclassified Streptomyces]MDF3142339.1 aldo/keto reductase [Streptomyces sp. T21Q-yed]WDF39164.1 aldo/keto reductase [Streptomyces sp. T12]
MTATTFRIGGDLEVRRLGFGAMHLRPESAEARAACVAVARRAVELGVTLIDTAHMYGWGANEDLLAEALHPYPDDLVIATKVGIRHTTSGEGWRHAGEPADLRAQVDEALRRLRLDRIELLQLHRLAPDVPLPDQLGALRDLREEGKVGLIGLSEVTAAELAQARTVVDIASVQNRYNLLDREHEPVLKACESAGIAFLPWRPVAAGQSGARSEIAAVAKELDATPTQVALAWLLTHSPAILPIPGTTSIAHLEENLGANAVHLTQDQYDRLNHASESA